MSELFVAVLEQPLAQRAAFLEQACQGDDALRREVEALLAVEGEAEGFLQSLSADAVPTALAALEEPLEGSRVGRAYGPYQVVEEIGRGGMSVVYRAEDRRLRRSVALKFLPNRIFADADARRSLMEEARAASMLDDPNICTIFGLDETPEGETFIAMAYYAGETLARRLERGGVPLGEGLTMALGITRGLAAAHAHGLAHRDLTPRNVMLPSRDSVKILDFGLASVAGQGDGARGGTPAYMSPEQVLGKTVGPAGDVWSLGVTLYEMFTAQRPFAGSDTGAMFEAVLESMPIAPRRLNSKIPEPLERLILRMLEKDPAERPPDAAAVLAALEPIVDRHRSRRTRLAVTAVVSLLGSVVILLVATRGPAPPPKNVPAARIVFLPIRTDSTYRNAVYRAAGVHEVVASELSRMSGVALISWTSEAPGEDTPSARRRLGRALGAVAVLEGNTIGDDTIALRLHDAKDDHVIWTSVESYLHRSAGVGRELAVAITGALGVPTGAGIPAVQHPGVLAVDSTTGHVYEAVAGTITWYDAERAAASRTHEGMKGHLATITSAEENDFIWHHLPQAILGGYWLGGYRAIRGGTARDGWYWVTGEPFEYSNWFGGGPNDYFGEDGLQFWPEADSAQWNDIDRISGFELFVKGFLVEYSR